MDHQITRKNHYVPRWYQRGFLAPQQSRLHVLDLAPQDRTLPNGMVVSGSPLSESSPKYAFVELDLYTTRFGDILNDEVERLLFGPIDKSGAEAVRAVIENKPQQIHNYFSALFDFLDTQKLRTPKGLDFLLERYGQIGQTALMVEMQRLRDMHCTMWTEGVREVVSATNSPVKFVVSDHPVTVYHREFAPDHSVCKYPNDPGVELVGSQTIYPLNGNYCLILTHIEYAEAPSSVDVVAKRTHARYRGTGYVRTDAFIRTRELSAAEVTAVNYVLKSRAKRYVAAAKPEWLYPEDTNALSWRDIEQILLPRDELWRFGGEMVMAFNDGTYHFQDAFGRTSKAHEYLAKTPPEGEPAADDYCPCGSARRYADCCQLLPTHERPTWTIYGIRERNITLCNAVSDILGLNKGKDWIDVRRELCDDQVKRIHEIYEFLWPTDTLLRELLPRPNANISRGVFLGPVDVRSLPLVVTPWLDYFDELVIPHPFPNAAGLRPENSPTKSPALFRDQTLRNALMLLELERYIRSGKIHLIPDPMDVDEFYRAEILASAKGVPERVELSERDKRYTSALAKDDHMRWTLRAEADNLLAFVKRTTPDIAPDLAEKVAERLKREIEADPLILLQPFPMGENGGQMMMYKSFGVDTGLFIASMTGAVPYCHLDAIWGRLHAATDERAKGRAVAEDRIAAKFRTVDVSLRVPGMNEQGDEDLNTDSLREIIRLFVAVAASNDPKDTARLEAALTALREQPQSVPPSNILVHLDASAPDGGFLTTSATRLVHTYGLTTRINPVSLAFHFVWADQQAGEPA
ncbi:DUF4238 domain-containing protein [Burkholderia dolosa]|uniref:DUF4238 domain-containing protein n=1 Tax=Burkholderia dolosa TaxID=152500 RepID=UPI001BA360CD|nr:DUF4238 domain-containing protein [Burkholderia dolosa]MBR8458103.1 DUF4238 domain-containing protein [Burkholderia dolosa]MDN7423381.1 DUF4238 domain-containing protein [Burkholderia dolosa]